MIRQWCLQPTSASTSDKYCSILESLNKIWHMSSLCLYQHVTQKLPPRLKVFFVVITISIAKGSWKCKKMTIDRCNLTLKGHQAVFYYLEQYANSVIQFHITILGHFWYMGIKGGFSYFVIFYKRFYNLFWLLNRKFAFIEQFRHFLKKNETHSRCKI